MALWTPLCWWFSIQNFPSFNSYPLTPVLLLCTSKRSLTWHKSSFFQFSKICFILCKWVTWSIVPLLSQIIDHRALQPVTCLPHHIHADAGTKAFWQKCRKYTLPSPQQPSPFYTPNYRLFSNTVIFQQILNLFSQLARYHIMHRPAVFYVKVFNFQTGINFFFYYSFLLFRDVQLTIWEDIINIRYRPMFILWTIVFLCLQNVFMKKMKWKKMEKENKRKKT